MNIYHVFLCEKEYIGCVVAADDEVRAWEIGRGELQRLLNGELHVRLLNSKAPKRTPEGVFRVKLPPHASENLIQIKTQKLVDGEEKTK